MQTDIDLLFTGGNTGPPQAITAGSIPSTGVLDIAEGLMLTGASYDNPVSNFRYSPQSVAFGADFGVGAMRLENLAIGGQAFVSANGALLNVAIQGAVDNLGGSLAGLTWTTFAQTGPSMNAALLIANARIQLPDLPHRALMAAGNQGGMPRFLRLLYQVSGGIFTAGTIALAGMFAPRNSTNAQKFYGGGFSAAP